MFRIGKEFEPANISRTVRFTEKLYERLNQIASQNGISFNRLVILCCDYALENIEEAPKL